MKLSELAVGETAVVTGYPIEGQGRATASGCSPWG